MCRSIWYCVARQRTGGKKKKKERDKAHLQANGHVRTKGKSLHGKVETVLLCLEL